MPANDDPNVNCQTCQPNSSTTGRKNTLTVDPLMLRKLNRKRTAAATIHQP